MIKAGWYAVLAFALTVMAQHEVYAQKEPDIVNVLTHPDKFYRRFLPKFRIKKNPPDSLFIRTYQKDLSVGAHVLSPAIQLNIDSKKTNPPGYDPASKFRTNVADVIGVAANYRYVSVGFSFLSNSGLSMHQNYAPSHYRTATIKYNSAAYILQFRYMRVQGFTDIHQSSGILTLTQRPDMLIKEFQFEGIYNFSWKKYSYVAPLTFLQRQLKSHAGFLLKIGAHYNRISGDAPLISQTQEPYYDNFTGVIAIQSLSIKIAPGVGGNLVFLKHFYLSLAAFTSFDLSFYRYPEVLNARPVAHRTFIFVLDGKSSVGYQSRRIYAGLRYEAERREGALRSLNLNTVYGYKGIELGYRFDAPRPVRKIYKKTMPPGM